ncbi:MAG: LysM peptidoglycan-binding domain-containing protein [Coriobacteriia bacterium]
MAATISYQARFAQSATKKHDHDSETAVRRRHAMQRNTGTSQATIRRLGRIAYAVLLMSVVLAVVIASVVRAERPLPHAWTAVTVQESGTLWALARAHPVDGLSTAETVDLIQRSNHLDSALITPGQALRVPAPEGNDTALASR